MRRANVIFALALPTVICAVSASSAAPAQGILNLGQSSQRSISSTSVSVTTIDGVPGFFQSTVTRPFVIGYVPVVGDYPRPFDAAQYLAQQDQRRLASVRQSHENLNRKSLQKYLSRAARAERTHDRRTARANYRRAIGLAGEPLRSELQRRLQDLAQH